MDPALPYLDSSPSNGMLSAASPAAKRWGDVASPLFGDVHFYNYGVSRVAALPPRGGRAPGLSTGVFGERAGSPKRQPKAAAPAAAYLVARL